MVNLPAQREMVSFRDAGIIFRNFAGKATQYNAEGVRNFGLLLNEEDAANMIALGWNVKALRLREDEPQMYHLKIAVNYRNRPPQIWLITDRGTKKTLLPEGMINMLDYLDFAKVDLTITPYNWEMGGKTGKKAYLKNLFFHVLEDELELEYAHLEQLNGPADSPLELEPGARLAYDYDGEIIEE